MSRERPRPTFRAKGPKKKSKHTIVIGKSVTQLFKKKKRERLVCYKCGCSDKPVFTRCGPHVKASCRRCGSYIKFVKQEKSTSL